MLRCSSLRRNPAAFYDFVDSNFLNNKRPAIPGGAWPLASLRGKSLADLQQIWFLLLKERAMLRSTREHYMKHQEELGAMPAPSRLTLVDKSIANIRQVVKERDAEATAQATAIFSERVQRGVYRYPPGPPPPPGEHDPCSTVQLTLARRVDEARLRSVLGRHDVLEPHKGIVRLTLRLPDDVLTQKKQAEEEWLRYRTLCSDIYHYHKWGALGRSAYDSCAVELAPGVFAAAPDADGNEDNSSTTLIAAEVPVPPPQTAPAPPRSPLERLKHEQRSALQRTPIQLGYFPNITTSAPPYERVEDVPRPTHPDDIEGPWLAEVVYDRLDGLAYVQSLGISAVDGADVLAVAAVQKAPEPHASISPEYAEAVRREMAQAETQMQWPHVPSWKYDYELYTRRRLSDIVQHNYSNVVDYVDREVLLTGRSVWKCPIEIDPTCGGVRSLPAHATKPPRYMNASIADVGVTDI